MNFLLMNILNYPISLKIMPNYAVGDIQGCFDELEEGLELINFNSKKDFLWVTGDLINRGPDSLRVLKYIFSIKEAVHIVLGNHDLHLLNCFFNKKKLRKEDTFISIFDDKNVLQMMNFLLQQDFVFSKKIFSDNGILKVGMVHAGIPKMMSLKQAETLSKLNCLKLKKNPQKSLMSIFNKNNANSSLHSFNGSINFFTRARIVDENGFPNFIYKGNKKNISPNFVPWFSKKNKITKDLDFLVFGHWAALQGKTNLSSFQALDTGCCWGKELTFLRLEDQKRFIIKSKQK